MGGVRSFASILEIPPQNEAEGGRVGASQREAAGQRELVPLLAGCRLPPLTLGVAEGCVRPPLQRPQSCSLEPGLVSAGDLPVSAAAGGLLRVERGACGRRPVLVASLVPLIRALWRACLCGVWSTGTAPARCH